MKIALNTCAALLLAAATLLHAQDYPKGPVTLVIPLAPGDATDTSARALAEQLSRELKVAIVPVNRPGAGGAPASPSSLRPVPSLGRSSIKASTKSGGSGSNLFTTSLSSRSSDIWRVPRRLAPVRSKQPGAIRPSPDSSASGADMGAPRSCRSSTRQTPAVLESHSLATAISRPCSRS